MTFKRRRTDVDATSSCRIDVSPTSFQRIMSHGRQSDVVSTSCACWEMDGTNSRPAYGSYTAYTETNGTYVFWPCNLLIVKCPFYRRYSINGPTIYFRCFFLSLTEKNQIWTTREGFLPSVSILPTSAPSSRLNDIVK